MREITLAAMVLCIVVGFGCGGDTEETLSDSGEGDNQESTDSGTTEEDVGTDSDSGMDANNGQQVEAGFDAAFTQPPPTLQDLNGTWIGPCYGLDGENLSIALIFSEDKMNSQIGFYGNAACQNRLMFIDIEMLVSIPEPPESSEAPDAYRLAFEVESVIGMVTVEEAVDIANDAELFGYSDWNVDEPKEIDGRDFGPSDDDAGASGGHLPEIGDRGEFVFKLNVFGNQLRIVDLGGGSLPTHIYTKQ